MTIFLDTSSLFKLYLQEEGSEELDQLFERQVIEQIHLSAISAIEFRSIVWRKVRMKQLSTSDAQFLLNSFAIDWPTYSVTPLNDHLLLLASQLLDKYGQQGLRTLDSIQLASAVSLRNDVHIFKTADTLLHEFFTQEALPVSL